MERGVDAAEWKRDAEAIPTRWLGGFAAESAEERGQEMKYHFKVHKEGKGYWAECVELKGCLSQGSNLEDLAANLEKALNLFLDEPSDSKFIFPLPKRRVKESHVLAVRVKPNIAFAFYLRQLRLKHKLTQREAAAKLGFKNIYSYQRLESSKTANPELATLIQIKLIFPEFDLNKIAA